MSSTLMRPPPVSALPPHLQALSLPSVSHSLLQPRAMLPPRAAPSRPDPLAAIPLPSRAHRPRARGGAAAAAAAGSPRRGRDVGVTGRAIRKSRRTADLLIELSAVDEAIDAEVGASLAAAATADNNNNNTPRHSPMFSVPNMSQQELERYLDQHSSDQDQSHN